MGRIESHLYCVKDAPRSSEAICDREGFHGDDPFPSKTGRSSFIPNDEPVVCGHRGGDDHHGAGHLLRAECLYSSAGERVRLDAYPNLIGHNLRHGHDLLLVLSRGRSSRSKGSAPSGCNRRHPFQLGVLSCKSNPRVANVLSYDWRVCGAGIGFGYVASMAAGSKWFPDKRGLVVGLMVGGSGAGSGLFGPLASSLIERVGWRSTFQILSAIFFVMTMIAGYLLKNSSSWISPLRLGCIANQRGVPEEYGRPAIADGAHADLLVALGRLLPGHYRRANGH